MIMILNPLEKELFNRGIPERFIRATWEDYKFEGFKRISKDFFHKFVNFEETRGFFFTGSCGSGKTMLASLIAKEIYLNGGRFRFVNIRDLKNEYLIACRSKGKIDMLDKYSNVDYLVLNDLGAEKLGEGTIECIFSILNNREEKNKYNIIITSNLTLKEIEIKVMDRIPSRIKGLCGDSFNFPKTDWRTKEGRYDPEKAKPVEIYNVPEKGKEYVPTVKIYMDCWNKLKGGNLNFPDPTVIGFMKKYEHLFDKSMVKEVEVVDDGINPW